MSARFTDISEYDVIEQFAVGGMAEILRARHKQTARAVAIKRLRQDLEFDPEVEAGFLRELQMAFKTRHKNLIQAFDRGSDEGRDWVALEFIAGVDLNWLLERQRSWGAPKLHPIIGAFIAREILDGLAFAHNIEDELGFPMGLVHRDMCPRNVRVSFSGGIHVMDFGASIAIHIEPPPDKIVGSPGYLSPEQARLEPLDQRSDVYAIGLILYEVAAGRLAFPTEGLDEQAILSLHQAGKLAALPRDFPEDIRMIIETACAPDREDRYPTLVDMRNALDETIWYRHAVDDPLYRLGEYVQDLFNDEHKRFREWAKEDAGAKSSSGS